MKRKDADPNWPTVTISLPDLAAFLGVSESAVMKWGREGGMPRGSIKGRYPLRDCIRWHLDRTKASAQDESKDIIEERRKLIVSQRQHQDLENAKLRGELFDAEMVKSVFRQVLATVATQLDGIAPRVTPRLITLSDPGQMQRVLFDECRAVRNATAAALEALAGADAGDADPEDPAPQKRRRVGRRQPRAATGQPGTGPVAD